MCERSSLADGRGPPRLRHRICATPRPVRGFRRALTEDERRGIAKAILTHLKLCGWEFRLPQHAIGHGTGRGGQPA
jgi:hypothetical protein